jgi:hypothetical protein
MHCWWKWKMVQYLWEPDRGSWHVKIESPQNLAIPLVSICLQQLETSVHTKMCIKFS